MTTPSRRNNQRGTPDEKPLTSSTVISAVICTYNRAPLLRRTLAGFFAQVCLDEVEHELIVVDNNSTDDTRRLVESIEDQPSLRYVFEPRQSLSIARNRGIAEARGTIVAFLDDDVIVDERWLVHMRNCFEQTGAAAVGGRSYLIYEEEPPEWLQGEFRTLLSEADHGPVRKEVPDCKGLFGLNVAFQKSALLETTGFDVRFGRIKDNLLGGDEIMVLRQVAGAGGRIVYDPDAVVGHIIEADRLEWDYFRRRAITDGQCLAIAHDPQRRLGRAVQIARSTIALAYTLSVLCARFGLGAKAYYRKSAVRRFLTCRARLSAQWSRLWKND